MGGDWVPFAAKVKRDHYIKVHQWNRNGFRVPNTSITHAELWKLGGVQ